MKSRILLPTLRRKNKSRFGRIIILTGARQTGKTTLARKGFPDFTYISMEDPTMREDYSKLTSSQWKSLYPKAILDEIQKTPQLFESIKAVYDQFEDTCYFLLGSSQLLLLQKVKESLAGRCSIYEVFPLTIPELATKEWSEPVNESFFQKLLANNKLPALLPPSFRMHPDYADATETFNHYLRFGGYPAISDPGLTDEERHDWLKNYIRTYLERDIRDLADFKNLDPFIRIQQTTALLTGSIINFSQLAKEADITSHTAKRFINYLELSYQTILLKPWHRNSLKRLSKSPKLHYLDPGIQRAILKKRGQMSGNEFESSVVAELYKQTRYIDFQGNFYHLRTLDGKEIDLLIETENGYIAIEVKMSSRVNDSDARHFSGLDQILDKQVLFSFVLSNDPDIKEIAHNTLALPAAMFLY
jgi:uncharacterized protein